MGGEDGMPGRIKKVDQKWGRGKLKKADGSWKGG